MSFWRKVGAIIWKDVLSEMRTREIISSVLVFAMLVIVTFNFAFNTSREVLALVAPGILWIAFAFAGILSLTRAFVIEQENGCIEGLMVCPVSREVVYMGKMLGSIIFMVMVEIIALPVFAFLFNLPVLTLQLVMITLMTTIGFAAVGTLFSALSVNTKAREMIMPVLFLPIVVPLIISAVKASGMAILGQSWRDLTGWLQIIAAFDVIFIVASLLVFNYVIEE